MLNFLLSMAAVVVPIFLLAVGLRASGRKVDWAPLVWIVVVFLVYLTLLRSPSQLPLPEFMETLTLNWVGKVFTIIGTIAMLYFIPRVGFKAAGVIWAQKKGWLVPVLITGAITLSFGVFSSIYFAPSPNTTIENLAFQATLPGIDEELFFRGLLLLLAHQAFGKNMKVFGVETGWGLWLVTIIFGLLHGLSYTDAGLSVNFAAIFFTGYIGFVLGWMRERTGSIVVPVAFHNIFNVTMAFV